MSASRKLPDGWEEKKLGEVCNTGAGGTPLKAHKEYYQDGDIPWLLSGEVSQGEIYASENKITKLGFENSSAKMFPKNSVLVAMYGATAGQVGILRIEACTNQAVCAIFPNARFVPEFVFYFFLNQKDALIAQAVGGAQPNISQEKIKNTSIPIPPLPEQKRIVTVLDEAFSAIAKAKEDAEKSLADTREIFESYLEEVFRKGSRGDAESAEWEKKKLEEICEIRHGYAFEGEYFSAKGTYVLLTPGNFYEEGGYRDRGEKQKYYTGEIPPAFILKKGDLLVAMTEQAAGLLGSPIIVPESNKFLHNQRLGCVIPKANVPWVNEFFFQVFNLKSVRKAIHESASGVKVRHTSPSKIGDVRVSFPNTMKAQKKIVDGIYALSAETKRLEAIYRQKIADLDELKKSILQKAFSGEL